MKKWGMLIVLLMIATFTMGAKDKGCGSESDKLAITQVALASVQIGAQWMNTKVQEKCKPEPHGGWSEEDCITWDENWPLVTDVIENILPWAIDKLWETTTPEEREEAFRIIKEHYRENRRITGQ